MIRRLNQLSLKQRLQSIIMLTVVLAILLVCAGILASGFLGVRIAMRSDLEVLAEMIGEVVDQVRPEGGEIQSTIVGDDRDRRYATKASERSGSNSW